MSDRLNEIILILILIIPGFIISYTRSKFSPQKRNEANEHIMRYIFYSTCMIFIICPIIYILSYIKLFEICKFFSFIILFFIIVILPVLVGILISILEKCKHLKIFLAKIGLATINNIPDAWDYKFSKMKGNNWIIVTTNDDKRIMGLFGTNSFASSEKENRDIYFQKIFIETKNDSSEWEEVENNCGFLIKYDQIKYMEFVKE